MYEVARICTSILDDAQPIKLTVEFFLQPHCGTGYCAGTYTEFWIGGAQLNVQYLLATFSFDHHLAISH